MALQIINHLSSSYIRIYMRLKIDWLNNDVESDMNAVLNALKFRHACKKFDPERKISQADLDEILECGHLSPSSFGMDHGSF